MNIKNNKSKKEMKIIIIHRVVLFIVFYLVFSLSAMKSLIVLYPLVGHSMSILLSGLISYFMSFTLYEYGKQKGIWVYGVVFAVILLMLLRYS